MWSPRIFCHISHQILPRKFARTFFLSRAYLHQSVVCGRLAGQSLRFSKTRRSWEPCNCRKTWLMHVWDMTHACVRHDSCMCETWLIHEWDETHAYVWHDSFIFVTRLIRWCRVIRWYVRHGLTCAMDMTHMCKRINVYINVCVYVYIYKYEYKYIYV